jgi:hypothetical protein
MPEAGGDKLHSSKTAGMPGMEAGYSKCMKFLQSKNFEP